MDTSHLFAPLSSIFSSVTTSTLLRITPSADADVALWLNSHAYDKLPSVRKFSDFVIVTFTVLWREDGIEEDPDYDGWTILDNIYGPNLSLCF